MSSTKLAPDQGDSLPATRPLPSKDTDGGDVIVIGAGLAGLSAAAELSSRGLRVTVIEKATQVGGKLTAWRDKDGATIEHGMHGWWSQYFNYFDLMRRAGADPARVLMPAPPATVVFADGSRKTIEPFSRHYPTPIFLMQYMMQMNRLGLIDMLSGLVPILRAFAFDHRTDFDRYDEISLFEFLGRSGATAAIHEEVFSPFARSFAFASTQELSAASVLSGLNFYFIGHQDDVQTSWCCGNPQELVVDPIARLITQSGGTIRTATSALELEVDDVTQCVTAVRIGEEARELRIPITDIPEDEPIVRESSSGERVVVRRTPDGFLALSGYCTHMGGELHVSRPEGCLVCPLHGGKFDYSGQPVLPPPTEALIQLPTRVNGSDVLIGIPGSGERIRARYFVLAASVQGVKRIISGSPVLLRNDTFLRMLNLEATDVVVVRLWLDSRLPAKLTTGVFPGSGLLDSYFVLSNFQDEFRQYDGTVIEVQAYVVRDVIQLSDDELAARVLGELRRLFPELSSANIRKSTINRYWDQFTFYQTGSNKHRPGVMSPYKNLLFAGDWIQLEEPWWMMEKAVVSGRKAANFILGALKLPLVPICMPRPDEFFTRSVKSAAWVYRWIRQGLRSLLGYRPLPP